MKDIIAHLAAWDKIVIEEVNQILNGKAPKTIGLTDEQIDQINDTEVDKRKFLSMDEVLKELEQNFNDTIEQLKSLSDEEFYKEIIRSDDMQEVSIARIYDYEYEGMGHTAAHAKQVEDFFKI